MKNEDTILLPKLYIQYNVFGEKEYFPLTGIREDVQAEKSAKSFLKEKQNKSIRYLNKNLLPDNITVEGPDEIACVKPYIGNLPLDIRGLDESVPKNSHLLGMHGFCYDTILQGRLNNNWQSVVRKALNYHCAFGPQFSVLMDGYRCEAVEAVRLNRITTLNLQTSGVPTIQTVSLTCPKFYDIAYAGLAPNAPVAFENICSLRDKTKNLLFRKGIEELLLRKSPSILIVVGEKLNFDPGVPVVYYKSRIQKLRNHEYCK